MHTASHSSTLRVIVLADVAAPGDGGRLTPAQRQMLCALVAAGPRGLPAADLVDGDPTSATVHSALRMAVSRLRKAIPGSDNSTISAVEGRYRLVLPVDAVDLWLLHHLAAGGPMEGIDDDVVRHLLRSSEVFPDVPSTVLLDDAAFAADASRRRLAVRVAAERPHLLDGSLAPDLVAHVDGAPHDEPLVRAALTCLLAAGDRRGALDLLAVARTAQWDAGLDLPVDLADTERQLLEGQATAPQHAVAAPRPARAPVSARVRDVLSHLYVGDRSVAEAAIERLDGAAEGETVSVVVTGLAGAGKSRLCAEIASGMVALGWTLVDAPASPPPATAAFGPFTAALPGLADEVRTVLTGDHDPESRRALMWSAARRALDELGRGGPLLLLVDDVQWFDTHSIELLVQLLSTPVQTGRLAVLVSGRSDPASAAAWATIDAAAARVGAPTVQPLPFDDAAMDAFVAQRRPSMTLRERSDIVGELTRRSKGLPGVAAVLLAGYDPTTRRLPGLHDLGRESAAALLDESGLSDAARTVGAIAALAGAEVDVAEFVTVSGLSVDEVLGGIDELLQRDLLVERSPVRVATSHALADAALLAHVAKLQAARWHAAAAPLHHSDVHRRARHLAGAIPFVSVDDAVDAQLLSGQVLLESGLPREAAVAFDTAATLAGGSLSPEQAVGWTRALDLSGAHALADSVRADAITAALADDRHDLALHLAISGLPEAEAVDGADTTIAHLRRVDPKRLKRRDSWLYATAFSRQLAATGHVAEAEAVAETAHRMARTRDEVVKSAVALRTARSAVTDPWSRLAVLDEVDHLVDECSPALAAEYLLMRAIDLYEARRTDDALACHARLMALDGLPPLRRWHGLLFQAMTLTDAGSLAEAKAVRAEALQVATAFAFREGESAFMMAEFVDLWRAGGDLSVLLPMVDAGALDPSRAAALQAVVALVLDAAGRGDEALGLVESLTAAVVAKPTFQSVPALAFAAPILTRSQNRTLVESAASLLARRGDALLVIGAGVACLGAVPQIVGAIEERRSSAS